MRKFNFKSKNNGSICEWFPVNEKLIPKREPDYTSYYQHKFTTFYPYEDTDNVLHDEDGNITGCVIEQYNTWEEDSDYNIKEYELIDEFTGSQGDTGYVFQEVKKHISSKYWYTKHGVYRYSEHWGKCGKSVWSLSNGKLGYSNFSNFIPK